MAGVNRKWVLAAAVLLLAVAGSVCGQGIPANSLQPGALSGKLTDLHSTPLAGVTVVVRSQSTGKEFRTTTAKNGFYRFSALEPGGYAMEAESPQLGNGRLDGILVQPGHETRVQTAMEFAFPPPRPLQPVFHEIPTEGVPVAAEIPVRALRLLLPAAQTMPGFLHEPSPHEPLPVEPPVLTAELRVAPWQPLRLTRLPALSPVRPAPPAALKTRPVETAALRAGATGQPEVFGTHASQFVASQPTGVSAPSHASNAVSIVAEQGRTQATGSQPGPRQARLPAAVAQLAPAGTATTSTLTGEELQSLPASGRRWEEFALDAPAASPAQGAGRAALRGPGQEAADTAVDGVSTRLAFGSASGRAKGGQGQAEGEPEGMGAAWAGGRGFAVSEAAIYRMDSATANVEAEASHAAGGRVSLSTERGTNGLHGQGFLYDRQNIWGARNPFTQWIQETAPATATTIPVFSGKPYTAPDHETVWGIGLGRQIRRDRLFWFAALDSSQRNDPGVSTVKHPDQFFAQPSNDRMQLLGAQLGSGSLAVPRYSQMLETLDGLLGSAPRTATQWVGFARVDWELGERHRLTAEATAANWNSPGGGLTRVSETYGNHSYGSSQASEQRLMGRWEAFVTPNLLAVTQASIGRSILSAHAETPSAFEKTLDINVWGQLPQIVVDSRYGFTIGNPSRFGEGSYPDERILHVQQSVDWVRGKLLVRAGFQVDHYLDQTGLVRNHTGAYHYANVENFATDALAYAANGITDALDRMNQHNCDQTGKAWRDSAGQLRGLGYLPCYSYYSQEMGPTGWHVSTSELAGYATAQWQPARFAVFSAGLRWEIEQLPQPIATVNNSALPLTEKTPVLGNNWGPRVSLALGGGERRSLVARVGYGIYYSRLQNSTLQTMLSNTGSLNGDLSFFLRPTDNLNAGGAPPFPYVFAGEPLNLVKPAAVEFAPNFRNPEVHQASASVEQALPGHVQLTAGAMLSMGRRLPITVDTNFDPAVNPGSITYAVVDASGKGPIKATQITAPLYATWPSSTSPTGTAGRLNPGYQQIVEMMSRANSTYEAAVVRIDRYARRGLTLHAHYTYAHAMDWNPNESLRLTGGSVLDPADFSREYGTSDLDVRHAATAQMIFQPPWKLHQLAGYIANGWALSGVGHYRSGLPYTIRTAGSLPKEFVASTGSVIAGLGTGMNGSGGDNRIYGVGNDNAIYNLGRNSYRYPAAWKADVRLAKRFDLGHLRELELLAESFNLFNHQNVTEIETTGYTIDSGTTTGGLPTMNFLTGLKANTTAFGQPLNVDSTNFYRERQIELGMRLRF
jgi:hypothetical protein